jgi:hypothetical protein
MLTSVLMALTGCGGARSIKSEDRAAIASVSVADAVKVTDEPMVIGSEASLGALFGAIGGAIAADGQKTSGQDFANLLKTSGIDVGQIVRERFADELKAHPFYGSRLAADGEYRFSLKVASYGINKTNTLSSDWVPNMRIEYQLLAPDGKILAQDWAMTMPFSGLPAFTYDQIHANPQILKDAFREAAGRLSMKLVKKMG